MNKISGVFVYCFLLLNIWVLSGCAESETSDATTKAIQEQLVKIEQRFGVASQSVRVLKNGELMFSGQQGFANIQLSSPIHAHNKYPTHSISKLFTNVLLMKLVEDGKLSLDQSIRHYLPMLPQNWQSVTVAHAWNHMSGLPEFFSVEFMNKHENLSKFEILNMVKDEPFEYETGTQTSYNQTGFIILTAIMEKLYGKPHPQLVKEMIFEPLNLSNSGFAGSRDIIDGMVTPYIPKDGVLLLNQDLSWPPYSYAFSALYSTPADLAKFMNAVFSQFFVRAETLEKLWQPMPRNNGQLGGFAQGWYWGESGGFNYVGHTGGNQTKLRQYYTDIGGGDTYTIAYLTNGSRSDIYIDNLVDEVMALLDPDAFSLEKLGVDLFDLTFSSADQTQFDILIENYQANGGDTESSLNGFINQKAYTLLFTVGADHALPLFKLNTRLFPQLANVWDSFAEAWLINGDRELAIKYYEKALSLDPNLQSSLQQLKELNTDK